ncbi:hypothetical protein CGCF413_v001336 [Colletotrichum fructicola]|nr:hypothetical protein CGCF413_v001336 [Colletotrichum fructicola]
MQSRGHAYTQFLAGLTIDSTLVAASPLQNNLGVGKNLLQLSSLTSREIFGLRTESDQRCPTNPASVSQTVIFAADNSASLKIITRGMTENAAQRSADNR